MIEIEFLGTSAMVPTKERNHSAVFLSYNGEGLLFDCGEGTQRQLKIAGISACKIKKIMISHWHGDHVLGLAGLIQTMSASDYEGELEIYGPKGTKERLELMFKAFVFEACIKIKAKEVESGCFFDCENYKLEAERLDHGIPCLGFSFIEKDRRKIKVSDIKKIGIPEGPLLGKLQEGKSIVFKGKKISADDVTYVVQGKKISYIADTVPCNNAIKLAKDADIMICESTYISDLEEKGAEYKHMTAKQAAFMAHQANVKKLILTHISQRYKTAEAITEEAKTYFNDVTVAYDFMKVKL